MLKHIASAAIASSVLMSSSAVMANDWFVGATVGSADHGYKEHNGLKPEFRDVYTAFRAGTYISENIRVYANLGHVKGSEEGKYEDIKLNSKIKNLELSISADYVDNLFQFSNTKYFIGGTLGYNQMKVDISGENQTDKLSIKDKDGAALYGLQTGLIQEFTPNISAEFGMRYAKMNNNIHLGDFQIKQRDQKLAYINVSYRF